MARQQDEDLLAQLDALSSEQPSASTTKAATNAATGGSKENNDDGALALDDIQAQLSTKRAQHSQTSRPTTPRLSSSTTSGGTNKSPKRAEHTPASSGPPSGRTSEERARAVAPPPARSSGEGSGSGRSYHQGFVPGEEPLPQTQQEGQTAESAGGGGWWGSMFNAATAAVSQAQTLAKEIRENEDAQKWAEQVRGYGVGLQSLSMLCAVPLCWILVWECMLIRCDRHRSPLSRLTNLHLSHLTHSSTNLRPRTLADPYHA